MKGEAQARVTEVNAEAVAKQTTLAVNAEAGIVFTKGEAEAKALALRAEAYRQFNEAAVIQTVLSMLPEIVRAAAEPMGRIDNLTVLSSDGASELVKNTTRTVAEASTAVKGLTGIDVPGLLGSALGGWQKAAGTPGGGAQGGSGGAGGSRGGERPPTTRVRKDQPPLPGPAQAGPVTPEAGAVVAHPAATASPGAAPAPATAAARHEPLRDFERAISASAEAADRAARDAAGALAAVPAPAITSLGRSSTLDDAAKALAADLSQAPGIGRLVDMRLEQLDSSGPAPVRALWRVAKGRLDAKYGSMTIGEVLERYGHGGGQPLA
jgi:flotillin